MADSFSASLQETVRKADYDRYLAALFAPQALRGPLITLYAFNYEVAKTAESVSQPIAGQIRLQWWRDRIAELYGGADLDHRLANALGEIIAEHDLPRELFDELIDARENDLEEAPFDDVASLEAYADATSGNIMRLAGRVLGAGDALDQDAGRLGVAYALTGLCRALPYHAARRRLLLPRDRVLELGISIEDVFSGKAGPSLSLLIAELAENARTHFRAGTERRVSRKILPALLPGALVPLYLRALMRPGFEPFRDPTDVAVHRRQLAMLRAMIRCQI
jgi:phytoene/squalene synthetase